MKTNKEILDIIGEKLIADIYDDGIKYYKQLSKASTKWGTGKEYPNWFKCSLFQRSLKSTLKLKT